MTIPVYYHIPKCGGCYVNGVVMRLLMARYGSEEVKIIQSHEHGVCLFLRGSKLNNRFNPFFGSRRELLNIVEASKELLAICVIPTNVDARGVFEYVDIILKVLGHKPSFYTTIRSPYTRNRSLYYYLTKEKFDNLSFPDFLKSEHIPDSWVIRNIIGVKDDVKLSEIHFEQAVNFLSKFQVSNIANAHLMVFDVFGFQEKIQLGEVFQNKSTHNNVTLESMPTEISDSFYMKVKWDTKLYSKLSARFYKPKKWTSKLFSFVNDNLT